MVPNSRKLPRKPRLLSGAYSAMNVAAPPYSPPVEKPCTMRSATSSTIAQAPMSSYVGSTPTRKVAVAISRIVIASTRCRPIRSPIGPQKRPPSGRSTNETANTRKVPTRPESGKKLSAISVAT